MNEASDKQVAYILSLAGVRFLSQVPGVTSGMVRRGLTKSEASELITELKAGE